MKMNRWMFLSMALTAVLVSLLVFLPRVEGYQPRVELLGDVEQTLSFCDLKEIDENLDGEAKVSLEALMHICRPWETSYSVLLVGSDGLVARIDNRLAETWLSFSTENGWEIRDALHPVSAQIKHLAEIVVVSEEDESLLSIGVGNKSGDLLRTTPGNLYLDGRTRTLHLEGSSSIEREEGNFGVDVFNSYRSRSLGDLLDGDAKLWISGRDGEVYLHKGVGELFLDGNRIGYRDVDFEVVDIAGILVDAPVASIADAYDEALYYTGKDIPVLLLFLDGFSYEQYSYAMANGHAPYLAGVTGAEPALSFYKPVTNVGFAAMITGQGPEQNNIHSRGDRILDESIFSVLDDQGKTSLLLEADIRILDAKTQEVLHVDTNQDGSIDDEIYRSALIALDQGYDYLLVHFHKIDDAGHSYGPFGDETLEQIRLHDGYVESLVQGFEGKVIIVADHGMHETLDGGTHGQVRWEDLVVPYLVLNGGE